MAKIRCPYCHSYISERSYPAHEAKHRKTRRDGQQTDYVTLPEDERVKGDLDGVPQIYVHRRCGVETGMPEDIIRSYLKDPYLYSADQTFCCGCGRHVPFRQCSWIETDENLQDYFDRLRAQTPVARPRGGRRHVDDRPGGDPFAEVSPNQLPEVDLQVGDGDGFMSVLAIDRHRLVIGTAPSWNWAMLVGLIAAAIAFGGQFVPFLTSLGMRHTPFDFCWVPFPVFGAVLGVFLCRRFRNQYVFDAERNEIITTTLFGLQRQRIKADRIPDVVIGNRSYHENTSRGPQMVKDPGMIFVVVFNRNGHTIFSMEGVRSDRPEVAFYLLVAVKAASILRVPLTFFEPPPEPDESVEPLWSAVADPDQRAVDRWYRDYSRNLRRSGFFRPEVVYALIGLAALVSAATWFRWLSITHTYSQFSILLSCVALAITGAVLCLSEMQPGLRPSPVSRPGMAVFIHRSEIATLIGIFLIFAAGCTSLAITAMSLLREPSHIAAARERKEREERERPRMSYRIEVRPDGTRVCEVEHHNMRNVDIGLELMTKPEPEARERGVNFLEHEERGYPRRAEVINALTPYLGHEKADIRRGAVRGLGNWGDANTIPLIEPLLNDPDSSVRRVAGEAISIIKSRQGRGQR